MLGKTVGHLKIVKELGRGGMGVVYLAEHVKLEKKFAVKCLTSDPTRDPSFSDRFYQEAKNQALLNHPNIVQATDFFEEEGQYFLVMEYVEGQELGELIEQKGKLSEEEALPILKDILAGLGFAHRKGMIHRDMKSGNVLVGNDGRTRILDFGIAILAGDKRLTGSQIIGTALYMSPEQIKHPKEIDHRSDIYSVGIVLFEMLTGSLPFHGETQFSIQEQQIKTPAPDPAGKNPDISRELSRIVLKAMEKNPDDRFQGCDEFLQQIKAYEASKQVSLTVQPKPKPLIWAVAALALAGVVLGTYLVQKKPQPVTEPKVPSGELQKVQPPVPAVPSVPAPAAPVAPAAPAPTFDQLQKKPSPEPSEPAASSEQRVREQHDLVSTLIKTCIKQAKQICKESESLEIAKNYLKSAQELSNNNYISGYTKQIKQINQNILEGMSEYNQSLAELSAKQKSIVKEEFYQQSHNPLVRLLWGHYLQRVQTGENLGPDALQGICRLRSK